MDPTEILGRFDEQMRRRAAPDHLFVSDHWSAVLWRPNYGEVEPLVARMRELPGHVEWKYYSHDGPELRERLPEVARATLGGVRFAVVHETGPARGREERCAAAYPDVDVLVFGHSHIPWDTTAPTGLRLINPGSPTDRRRQPHGTFVTAVAADGALHDVTFHTVPR